MGDSTARRNGVRFLRPLLWNGVAAGVIAAGIAAPVIPVGCVITWTRTGGVWTYLPDCSRQSPPSPPGPPAPSDPPPGPGEPPPAAANP